MEKSITTRIYSWLLIGSVWLCSFTAPSLFAQNVNQWMNMDFEQLDKDGKPVGWDLVGEMLGTHDYQTVVDKQVKYHGKYAIRVENKDTVKAFGAIQLAIPIDFTGKELKLEGYIKRENIDSQGYVGIWMRIETGGKGKEFYNMKDQKLIGTKDWTKYTITLPIPKGAIYVDLGGLLIGKGKVWFDDFTLTLDGKDLPYTKKYVLSYINPEPPSQKTINAVKEYSNPMRTLNVDTNHDDLKEFGNMVGDAEVVALGEPTHGSHEVFKMKNKLIEYLVTEKHFRLFAIEAGQADVGLINKYILNGEGTAKEAAISLSYGCWSTQEVADLIEWMREYNKSAKEKVEFEGVDMQFYSNALRGIKKYGNINTPNTLSLLDSIKKSTYETITLPKAQRSQRFKSLVNTAKVLQTQVLAVLDTANNPNKEWVKQYTKLLIQYYTENIIGETKAGEYYRDSCMADNAIWLYHYKKLKMILWAHNDHIGNHPGSMGGILKDELKERYLPVGIDIGSGSFYAINYKTDKTDSNNVVAPPPYSAYEYIFNKLNQEYTYFDLRKMSTSPKTMALFTHPKLCFSAGAVVGPYMYIYYKLARTFEIFVYIHNSSHSKRFKK